MRDQPDVAVLTDLWPSRPQPYAGSFVRAQVAALAGSFRQVVLVPRLVAPRLHRRIWHDAVNGWQNGYEAPGPAARVLRYPMLRVPKGGEVEARLLGSRVALAAARERPALVHGHFLLEVGPTAVKLGRALGVPSIVTVHGTDGAWAVDGGLQERYRRRMLQALRDADRVIVVEAALAERLVAAGAPRERLRVIPMGVDENVFFPASKDEARARLGLPSDRLIVLFVGRPTAQKGIDVFEQALESLGSPFRGVVVGPRRPASASIEYVGPQAPEKVACWLSASDVFCLPSLAEAMPVSVVEALACGRPVVASRVGGIPEQVEDGRTGILVPPGDAGALVQALREAGARDWDEDELRAASRPFWWSALAPRLAGLYAELLAESTRKP